MTLRRRAHHFRSASNFVAPQRDVRWPSVIGFEDEKLDGIMVAPKAAWAPGVQLPVAD